MGGVRRNIPFMPAWDIDSDGVVYLGGTRTRVPSGQWENIYGVPLLVVSLDGRRELVSDLLSHVFHERRLLIPRDGNTLHWAASNRYELTAVTSPAISLPNEILTVWYWYQYRRTPVRLLAEKTGLISYSQPEFTELIRDILTAGIR